jgi:hypothetical protein
LAENQRFEIVGFLALSGRILWFGPRREYSSIPTANSRSRRAQGLSRLAASSRPPAGLGLDWPEHGGILDRIGAGGAHHIVGKFKPLVLGAIHAAGDKAFGCACPQLAKADNPSPGSRRDEKENPPEAGLLFTTALQARALSDDGNGGDSPPAAASGRFLMVWVREAEGADS